MSEFSARRVGEQWAAQQLAEFLALVSTSESEQAAVRDAVEYVAASMDAEVAAVARNGQLLSSVGFARDAVPVGPLLSVAWGLSETLDVPGPGPCHMAVLSLEDDVPGQLVLGRRDDPFESDELNLLRAMARVLTLALQTLRVLEDERGLRRQSQRQAQENAQLLGSLRERQGLLERLSNIQRAIVRRAGLEDVLEAVVDGTQQLVHADAAGIRLLEPIEGQKPVLSVIRKVDGFELFDYGEFPLQGGISSRAMEREELVAVDGGDSELKQHIEQFGVTAVMVAPVIENGRAVGILSVASAEPDRRWTATEQEMVLAFAEHASLALTDARNFGTAVHRSLHDLLTGLPNRALFLDRLEHATRRARRGSGAPGPAVLFLDLDGFKRVNDSLGHAAGDEVLVEVSSRLTGCIRPSDTASRFGGDEFAILLEEPGDERNVEEIADRVMAALQRPFRVADKTFTLSVSIGIATPGSAGEDMLRNADLAMYHAKGTGKGRYEVFDPGMHTALTERLRLEADLARAVEHDEFDVVYQPIVSLRSGAVVAVEALARWNHPERGVIGPGGFIPAAEETGLIRAIGRRVLEKACDAAAAWQADHRSEHPLAMSVNLSVVQLEHAALIGEVSDAIVSSRIQPGSLILEITETLLMHDAGGGMLNRLKDLGVQLAVDDFGTGYSSLQYLQRLPIDILKIAKPFVDGIVGEGGDSALAQAIIDVGQSLDLRVIAEGLERAEQVSRVVELGCEWGQGYHFARPVAAGQVSRLLAERGVEGWSRQPDLNGRIGERARPRIVR
jgi:diguanylate cyclase (GGDEF)-like protein